MKLAEALLLRSDMQKKLASLQQRIQQNVLIQEGDTPSEDPHILINEAIQTNQALYDLIEKILMKEAIQTNQTLYDLIEKIHLTNAQTQMPNGQPLIKLLNKRDCLIAEHRILQHALDHAQRDSERYSMREIKWLKTISIAKIQKQADDISASLRQLNVEIQAMNWQVDLV